MHFAKIFRRVPQITFGHKIAVRNGGQFRRTQFCSKNDQLAEIRQTFFHNRSELAPKDWQNVTDLILGRYKHIQPHNIEAVIVGICNESHQLTLANSFINYLKESGKTPNDATLGKLLRIYNGVYHARGGREDSLTDQEQNEILEIYERIRSKHDILDSLSCEHLIYGLVCTTKWRDGLHLMEMVKITATPTLQALTELSMKAFKMQDLTLGWRLLQETLEYQKLPKCETFLEYLNVITNDLKTLPAEFDKLLKFLEQYDVVITEKIARAFSDIAIRHPSLLSVSFTKLKRHGRCCSCDQYLENVSLTDQDFELLRSSILDKVLIRSDVFQRSTPKEVEHFRDYVEKTGPYDCVVDGLNVAYSMGPRKPPQVLANLLANVVKHFKNKNKHVLVLGRQHMRKWPQKTMRYIKENAALFLANDLSHDDPFLLYATLKSGQTTDFFSRDFMRQHAFLLGPELKAIFRRWQQEHQYSLVTQTESGKVIVKEPMRHLICAHKVGNNWHVPFKTEYSQHLTDSFDIPEHWLCINLGLK